MNTIQSVTSLLGNCLSSLHGRLAKAVISAVDAVVRGGKLTLSQLARSIQSDTNVRHRVKQVDRLLGNRALQHSRVEIYRQLAAEWLVGVRQVIVLVDWSDATEDQRWHLLRASVAIKGRSVTLYEEVHSQRDYGSRSVHRNFLNRLTYILPSGVEPTIVTDAGFHSTWFNLVAKHGWPWIGRIRGRDMVSISGGPWKRGTALYALAKTRIQTFADAQYVRSNPTPCRLVLIKRESKKRHRRTKKGRASRARASLKASRSARDPWLLACSPNQVGRASASIVETYSTRMRIEQSFRDLKHERLGLGFSSSRTRSRPRLEILLLIAALAHWLMRLIGECAEQAKMQKDFQSVPRLKHKEISVLTLARRVIDAGANRLERLRLEEGIAIMRREAEAIYEYA